MAIGRLQRFATDALMARDGHPYERAAPSGRRVAVVGAGPAGLACAHRLALKGHDVTLFDARAKAGGLNEFGIAGYKTVDRFAEREVEWLLGIGGITLELGRRLGGALTLDGLARDYDAVFLGFGLAGVNALDVEEEAAENVREVEFAYTEDGPDGLGDRGETFRLRADQVFKAIGQKLDGSRCGVELEGRKIRVTGPGRTSRQGVWAGGDCVADDDDLVVTAVAQGRDAAEDIHAALMS